MRFNLLKVAATLAAAAFAMVQAVPAPEVPDVPIGVPDGVSGTEDVTPADFYVGRVWLGAEKTGTTGRINVNAIPSPCYNFVTAFNNVITSIVVDSGIRCYFYVNSSCGGAYVYVQNGGYAPNLGGTNYDNSLSSIRCYAY